MSHNTRRQVFEWLKMTRPETLTDIRYTVGGGKGSDAREVLIFSRDVAAEPAGLF